MEAAGQKSVSREVTELRERAWKIMRAHQEACAANKRIDGEIARMSEIWRQWREEAGQLGLSEEDQKRIKYEAMQMLAAQPLPKPGEEA